MLKASIIFLFIYAIFILTRKIIFFKKREYKFLKKPALINYFID